MKRKESGVSPIIGIILILSVTVGIVALAATIVFDIGTDSTGDRAKASASLRFDSSVGNGQIEAEVLKNKNVKEFRLRVTDSSHVSSANGFESGDFSSDNEAVIVTGVGNYGSASVQLNSGVDGTAKIIAVPNETDRQQVIQTESYQT